MIKHIAAACLFGTALASAPAFAQNPEASPPRPATQPVEGGSVSSQFLTQMSGEQWRGSKLVGVDVYGTDNQKIGDINEIIVDRNGQAKAIVIGVGGFLGIGEKNVAIPFDKVQWNAGGDRSSMTSASTGESRSATTQTQEMARTTTGSSTDPNAQPGQTASTGGATLSSPPSGASDTAGSTSTNMSGSATNPTPAGSRAAASSGAMQDYPERALVQMSKQDLQNAPEFHYASDRSSASGGSRSTPAGAGANR